MASRGPITGQFAVILKDGVSGPAQKASQSVGQLKNSLGNAGSSLGKVGESLRDVAGGAEQASSSLGGVAPELSKIIELGPEAAIIAVAAAFWAAAAAVTAFAFAAADSKIALLGNLEALTGSGKAANELADQIDEIARKVPLSTNAIEGMAKRLALAGLEGEQLRSTLELMAQVGSVSETAAAKLQGLVERMAAVGHFDLNAKALRGTGLSIQQVFEQLSKSLGKSTKEVEALMKAGKISVEDGLAAIKAAASQKFGPAIEKQMLPIGVQMQKLKENLQNLFEDIDVEGFLKGLRDMLSVFDSSTTSGKALHLIVTSIFSGLFNAASAVFPYIKAFFKGMVAGALQIYIALKPVGKAIMSLFGGKPNTSFLDFLFLLGKGVAWVAGIIAGLVGIMAAIGGAIVAPILAVGAALWSVIFAIGAGIGAIIGQLGEWASAGVQLVQGLAQGIADGASAVIDAALGVARGAIDAVKGALGIHSPSKVMAEMGGHTASGFAEGMQDASPMVKTGAVGMSGAAVSGAKEGKAGGAGTTVTIGAINISGVADSAGAKQGVLDAFAEAFGPLQLQVGV
jgi:tape measure protein